MLLFIVHKILFIYLFILAILCILSYFRCRVNKSYASETVFKYFIYTHFLYYLFLFYLYLSTFANSLKRTLMRVDLFGAE